MVECYFGIGFFMVFCNEGKFVVFVLGLFLVKLFKFWCDVIFY